VDSGGSEDNSTLTVSSMIKEIQGLKDKFKDDDQEQPSPFQVYKIIIIIKSNINYTNQFDLIGGHFQNIC